MNSRENVLWSLLRGLKRAAVACSGGVDSLLLAHVVGRLPGCRSTIVHATGPAVPAEATNRVFEYARIHQWNLLTLDAGEFADPQYRKNPIDRCYFCKTHLYHAIYKGVSNINPESAGSVEIFSGTNLDDLSEYRPGLIAAKEWSVRHPFVEAGLRKDDIRNISRSYGLPDWDLPASPCLASRLYTGTEVTKARLQAVEEAENLLKNLLDVKVVRCRIRGDAMRIEVPAESRPLISEKVIISVRELAMKILPELSEVCLDPLPYSAGRAFVPSS